VDLGIKLRIEKVGEEGENIVYTLFFDVERWRDFFRPELEAAMKAAVEVRERLPVKDRLPYMLGWVNSDVAISGRRLSMSTSHLWQFAETRALFGWSVVGLRMSLTLEGPKLAVVVEAPLEELDEAIRRSAEGGWLRMLGTKEGLEDLMHVKSWDDLKRWVAGHWSEVIDAVKRQLESVKAGSGFDLTRALEELERLKSRLDDDKIAREVVAPALLLIQAERLGVNEETLRYFCAVVSGAIDGDGYVSAARREVGLTCGEREIALLWAAVLVAYGIKAEVRDAGGASKVIVSGGDAARLADLYIRYGSPLLEGGDRLKNHKLAEAVKLAAEGLNIRWEMSWGSQTPENFEKRVEVNGKTYVVNVKGREAVEEDRGGRKLLRIKITAEVICVGDGCIVDRVEREYTITYSRRGKLNAVVGYVTARADAPGGREADAERLAAVIEALTGKKPKIRRRSDGAIVIECYREHLEGFMRYKELTGAIKNWLEETGRR
jgi:hypothetical protein